MYLRNVPGGDVVALAVAEAATVVPAKGAVVLRKALDAFVAGHPNADSAEYKKTLNVGGKGGSDGGDAVSDRVWTKKLADAEKKAQKVVDDLQTQSTRQITALRSVLI
ncbi:hypothetical protein DYB36_005101 [Aphanomyces astaci]|uniref:Uncharacterized protein n=1 Tax=Aphanomyces astaci TaxID=112090 RepID=A0A397BN18_APHAT|nr:hypothetical protein DYB36_005101 [Aphanomyces astaci]